MKTFNWTERIVPTLMVAGVVSLVLTLLLGGFIAYQWVLACEASVTALLLLIFFLRYYRRDKRKAKWPLLPLSIIFAAGGAKSFYVATGNDTPLFVIVVLLAGVVWFAVSSLTLLRAARHVPDKTP